MSAWDLQIILDESHRLGVDAADPRDVPEGFRMSHSWQGGDRECSWATSQLPGDPPPGLPFSDVRVVSEGGAVDHFEGELHGLGRSAVGGVHRLTARVVGYATRLEKRQDVAFLGIDRDLGRWVEPSLARRIALASSFKWCSPTTQDGAVIHSIPAYEWSSNPGRPLFESVYDASPLTIGSVHGVHQSTGSAHLGSGVIITRLCSWTNTDALGEVVGANLSDGTGTPHQFSETINNHVATIDTGIQSSSNSTTDATWEQQWSSLAVVGDHGLELVGTGPADYGLRAEDIWAYLVETFCDGLEPGRIVVDNPELVLQHVFDTGPTVGAIVNNVNVYHGCSWEVRKKRVNMHPFGDHPNAKTWLVRSDDPAYSIDDDGIDAAKAWTGVVVNYTTPSGQRCSVGPPGSLALSHSADLQVTDPFHPAVAAGQRITGKLDLDVPTVEATAIAAGAVLLREQAARQRKGKVRITGHVWDDQGVPWPCFYVKAGHFVRVVDSEDPTPRRLLETEYDHDTATLTGDLDDEEHREESFVAHLMNRTTGKT